MSCFVSRVGTTIQEARRTGERSRQNSEKDHRRRLVSGESMLGIESLTLRRLMNGILQASLHWSSSASERKQVYHAEEKDEGDCR